MAAVNNVLGCVCPTPERAASRRIDRELRAASREAQLELCLLLLGESAVATRQRRHRPSHPPLQPNPWILQARSRACPP